MRVQPFLDRQRVHGAATGVNHVHLAVELHEVAAGILPDDVTGEKPSLPKRRIRQRLIVPIPGKHCSAPHLEASGFSAVYHRALVVGNAHGGSKRR